MVLSTAYFPNISWIEAFKQGARIEIHENYQKQTARNRCRIMTASGSECLTVPLQHTGGLKVATCDVLIDYATPWQRTHSRAVMAAYRSAPYWAHFEGLIMPLFDIHEKYLFDLNQKITERLLEVLKIDRELVYTTRFVGAVTPPRTTSPEYYQTFSDRLPFERDLSVIDAIFCEGRLPSEE
ncbi:MAG: WbqC family protein [Mucinivorans sp.]